MRGRAYRMKIPLICSARLESRPCDVARRVWRAHYKITAACEHSFLRCSRRGARPADVGDDSERLLTIDHYVRVKSTVPAIAGQTARSTCASASQAGTALRGASVADRVVLFVHGAGTPAEVAFDVPYQDYSWMAYLARAGFDVFSMDMTGYGRSTRPAADERSRATSRRIARRRSCRA